MIIKCASCKCEIELDEEQVILFEDAGFDVTSSIWCDDCVDSAMGTREDKYYDEMRGK